MKKKVLMILMVLGFLGGCTGGTTSSDPEIPEITEISGNCNWNKSPIHVSTGVYAGQTDAELMRYCKHRMHHGANSMGASILYLFDKVNPLNGVALMGWKNDCGPATVYIEKRYTPAVIVSKVSDKSDECIIERKQ